MPDFDLTERLTFRPTERQRLFLASEAKRLGISRQRVLSKIFDDWLDQMKPPSFGRPMATISAR
jgi:hypothetical protein